jgi:UDP-4-amino-4,6-dideoxy-N-acetyl-beta-L-altrosamine N-acetyltransferase
MVASPPSVSLRPLAAQDAELVVAWRSRPDVHDQLFAVRPPTLESHRAWFESYARGSDRRELIILVDGRPAGTVALAQIDLTHRRAEYGILIGEPWARGTGAAEAASRLLLAMAFGELDLERVFLLAFEDNQAALRLYERLGFRREGLLRSHVIKDGRPRDVVVMGLLRGELPAG